MTANISVGIEMLNVFGGSAFVNVGELLSHRGENTAQIGPLLLKEKTVAMPWEDPVTMAVNAAKPIIDSLSDAERDRIELIISGTESGIDFGKSLSTYIHEHLRLNRNVRLLEVKNACYSGTAGLQMAANFILSRSSPGAKALVLATDVSRFALPDQTDSLTMDWAFAEPTGGAGAAALLVSEIPLVFRLDVGASGVYAYEVMDTCRPTVEGEAGSPDLGMLTYLDCCENAFRAYRTYVPDTDFKRSFDYLCFHSPFGGMVKSAHRAIMRKMAKSTPAEIEEDFERRMMPGLRYAQATGNIMGASVFLSLASTIDHGRFDHARRIGCFSYGSGCCSEFFSGVVPYGAGDCLRRFGIDAELRSRHRLSMIEYDDVLSESRQVRFGTRNVDIDLTGLNTAFAPGTGRPRLVLQKIREFHREYTWID
jgi:polyketide biosynthesis 3-hydroxy-3-methylglutaryl-CoA synthase-like enzyme PksG